MTVLFLDLDNTIFSPRDIKFQHIEKFYLFVRSQVPDYVTLRPKAFEEDFIRLSLPELMKKYQIEPKELLFGIIENSLFERDLNIKPFGDYRVIKKSRALKFLVTTGLMYFQRQKIRSLDIERDFEDIVIDDPLFNPLGKKMAFKFLINKHDLNPGDIWVIGDNPESEIEAAKELELKTILIDRKNQIQSSQADRTIQTFTELELD